ncbi:hypothetical protein BX600DRAFT_432001 [Xylariales sp. PMI_506]|nr:hypothetical protein BX600DRAFT_432001 [Xylariales sp. PMI_506]
MSMSSRILDLNINAMKVENDKSGCLPFELRHQPTKRLTEATTIAIIHLLFPSTAPALPTTLRTPVTAPWPLNLTVDASLAARGADPDVGTSPPLLLLDDDFDTTAKSYESPLGTHWVPAAHCITGLHCCAAQRCHDVPMQFHWPSCEQELPTVMDLRSWSEEEEEDEEEAVATVFSEPKTEAIRTPRRGGRTVRGGWASMSRGVPLGAVWGVARMGSGRGAALATESNTILFSSVSLLFDKDQRKVQDEKFWCSLTKELSESIRLPEVGEECSGLVRNATTTEEGF